MSAPAPFQVATPERTLQAIRARVRDYDWDALPDAGGWSAGVGLSDLRRLCERWTTGYDWRAQEAALNRLPHFTATVDGQLLHFLHMTGSGSGRMPLILSHGWPGSFLEFAHLVEPLVHPERFGGDPADGFDVVVPSLPGFAFSGRPPSPIGPRRVAELFGRLMTDTLGYGQFLAQGGDWGSAISTWLGHLEPERCLGIHLNMVMLDNEDVPPETPEEKAHAARRAELDLWEGAYSKQQATRPQTLGVGLSDSPVGIAAWILEKFGAWADLPRDDAGRPDLWSRFDPDTLLTNIMLYVATNSFPTSTWIYHGRMKDGLPIPKGVRIETPTAVGAFPDPTFPPPPRSRVERKFNLVQWSDMPRGGHFAAMEAPDLLLDDVRRFARRFR